MIYNYFVCLCTSFFSVVHDESRYEVSQVLQAFRSKEEADDYVDAVNQFYDYSLQVVPRDMLGDNFR